MTDDSLGEVLLSAESIRRKVREIGAEISHDYAGKEPVLVGVLNGALVFMADLMREIDLPLEAYMMAASSYDGYESTGKVDIIKPLDASIAARDVVLVEDIVDTGITLDCLLKSLQSEKPASLEVCALLDKKSCRQVEVPIKYTGFEIPDEFVVGYGLDYNQQYRNLPYVASMNAAAINGTG
jgi:hypoxanthine phosphoribosyltransferase